jgi:hypothetical protein
MPGATLSNAELSRVNINPAPGYLGAGEIIKIYYTVESINPD